MAEIDRVEPEESPMEKWVRENGEESLAGPEADFLTDELHLLTLRDFERIRLALDAIDRRN